MLKNSKYILNSKPSICPICNAKVVEDDYYKEHYNEEKLCRYGLIGKDVKIFTDEGCIYDGMYHLFCSNCGNGLWHYCDTTVGKLRELIKDLPDDAPIYYERIEDKYFNDFGWKADKRPCDYVNICENVKDGKCKEDCFCFDQMIRTANIWISEDSFERKSLYLSAHY